jgi:hypothetical protein
MLTRLQAREEKEKGGSERRRGDRRSNQPTALLSDPGNEALMKREELLLCRPNMHDECKNKPYEGELD